MHVTEILLDAAERGELAREDLLEVLKEHAAAHCSTCREALAAHEAALGRARGAGRDPDLDPLARLGTRLGWGERQLGAETKAARAWVREIVQLDREERRGRIHGAYKRFRGPVFATLLLEAARRAIPGDPVESLSLADAALLSCNRTNPHQPDPEIRAAALAVRGNAQRALGRLRAAEEDLAEAGRLLDVPGVADPGLPAEVESYLGSLRRDQGRIEDAARHLRRAGTLYRVLGEGEKAAGVLLNLGGVHYYGRMFEAAVEATEQALELLDEESDAWLRGFAHYNLAHHLHASGDSHRAEAELESHHEVLVAGGDHLAKLVTWLRTRIAWSRGDLRAAERGFERARARAAALGHGYDAGLIALELALVHLAQGRTARVKKLAVEALQGLAQEEEVEREVRAALALVAEAARQEALTREMVENAVALLEDGRYPRRAARPERT